VPGIKRTLIFYAVAALLPLFVLEAGLQAYYYLSHGAFLAQRMALPIFSPDEDRYYALKPNLAFRHSTPEYDVMYYTDSRGMRTDRARKEKRAAKAGDVYRILFLGPSLCFGWGNDYEDTYVARIGSRLTAGERRIEIMNLGTPGQPGSYQLRWLKRTGHAFEPDMIVQTIYGFPANLETNARTPSRPPVVRDGYLCRFVPSVKKKLLGFLKRSAVLFYGWYGYQVLASRSGSDVGLGTELYDGTGGGPSAERFIDYMRFVRTCVGKEIPVVFIFVPYSYAVRPGDTRRWRHLGYRDPYRLRDEAENAGESLNARGITFINPTERLIAEDRNERMYYLLDIHLTGAGNRVIAEESIPAIQRIVDAAL
jgi:hypothetical protein